MGLAVVGNSLGALVGLGDGCNVFVSMGRGEDVDELVFALSVDWGGRSAVWDSIVGWREAGTGDELGSTACGRPFEGDLEGVELEPLVTALDSGLCEGPGALNDDIGEDRVDAADVDIVVFNVVSEICGVDVDAIDESPAFEEEVVGVELTLRFDDVAETTLDGDSLLEDTGGLVCVDDDVVLGSVDVLEEVIDDISLFEDMDVAAADVKLTSGLVEVYGGGADDELVSKNVRDVSLVIVDPLSRLDDDPDLVDVDNVAGVAVDDVVDLDVVIERDFDEDPNPDDVRDVAGVVVDVVPKSDEKLVSEVVTSPSGMCDIVSVPEAEIVVSVRAGVEEESTAELGPELETEDVSSAPTGGEFDDESAPEGLR